MFYSFSIFLDVIFACMFFIEILLLLGLTPVAGIGLRENDYPDTMVAAGPLCKKSEDLVPLLKILISPNVHRLRLDEPVNIANLKVFYQENSGDLRASKINRTMQATLLKVVQHFRELTGSATKVKTYRSLV